MTILADFLHNNSGQVFRIYPSTEGELVITQDYHGDGWSNFSYTIPSAFGYSYKTLADSAGTAWYMWLEGDELVLSEAAPTQVAGVWIEPQYGPSITEEDATVGSETYLNFKDINSTDWYVYPSTEGELILSNIEPT